MEDRFPGMWQRWYRNQCVAVGWASEWGYNLEGPSGEKGWTAARNAIKAMKIGDKIVVTLNGNRVGRIGEITRKDIADSQWVPLVPPGRGMSIGEMGRRINVRWDLTVGPDNQDLVVQLPDRKTFSSGELRSTVVRVKSMTEEQLVGEMNDQTNWVSLLGKFSYEKALSDYIANYPNRLEDGLLPHPNSKIRERVFDDKSRLDVLLIDRQDRPVVVECKQHAPSRADIDQLRHYMARLKKETGEVARGILVHGGAGKLDESVARHARTAPKVEVVNYTLDVVFRASQTAIK